MEGCPENKGIQQNTNEPQDCILAVSDDGMPGTGVVSPGLKPVGESDAIHVQHIQTEEEPNYSVKTIREWV